MTPPSRRRSLEALVAGRDARDELRVYGDYLQECGALRGELVALQCAGHEAAAAAFLAANRRALLGAIVELEDLAKRRGLDEPLIELTWRGGFLRTAALGDVGYLLHKQDDGIDQASAARDLLSSPAARFVEELGIAGPWVHEHGVEDGIHEALRACGPFPALRRLAFVTEEQNSFIMAGNFEHVATACPNLRELAIDAGDFSFGAGLELASLESLVVRTTALRPEHVAAILASRLPGLGRLVLWFGPRQMGRADVADVVALLEDAAQFPALRDLGLCNHLADELIAPLAHSGMLRRQLTHLDLSGSTLSDDGARALSRMPRPSRICESRSRRELHRDARAARRLSVRDRRARRSAHLGPRVLRRALRGVSE